MRRLSTLVSVAGLALTLAAPTMAAPTPRAVRKMIIEAARSDDPAVFAAIVAVAKRAHPDSAAEIDDLAEATADGEATRRPSPSMSPPPPHPAAP